jgi:hypothetical protein
MPGDLEEAKQRVKARFLGNAGVHGVGIRASQNAVAVYVDRERERISDQLLAELKQAAAPWDVVVIHEDRASAVRTSPPGPDTSGQG